MCQYFFRLKHDIHAHKIKTTRQVTRAIQQYTPRLIVYSEIKPYEFSNGKALQNNS